MCVCVCVLVHLMGKLKGLKNVFFYWKSVVSTKSDRSKVIMMSCDVSFVRKTIISITVCVNSSL